jgi:hypothetical protein
MIGGFAPTTRMILIGVDPAITGEPSEERHGDFPAQ